MECIKKLHDKLDQVDKVRSKLVKFVNLVMQIFRNGVPENFNFWGERRHKSPVNLAEWY